MNRSCDQCHLPFEIRFPSEKRRYCSAKCKRAAFASRSNIMTKKCHVCAKEFVVKAYRAETARYCSVRCRSSDQEHCADVAKKSGDTMRGRGLGSGYVKEGGRHQHRVVAERVLGRPLLPGEIVHHKDEVKSNNDPNNLEVTRQSIHIEHHRKKLLSARKQKAGY